jgi:2-polyprenyl-3-methyl-5-hydroxy-6-metoxy-1,4-benzoquinol methylase
MSMKRAILRSTGRVAPKVAPLSARKAVARWVNRLPGRQKEALILALLSDWADRDPAEYHRFIWSNHLSYARYYDFREFPQSRGQYFTRLHPLRLELMSMVVAYFQLRGIDATTDVQSYLDVGCSLGYLPRFAETTFRGARRILGIDIDSYAIAEGRERLRAEGSSVTLEIGDMASIDELVGDERFDVVTCTGVLQYFDEEAATQTVATMLRHTSGVLALSGPASADEDNGMLEHSLLRAYDHSLVHNFDRMIAAAGGHVVTRRWEGRESVEGKHGAYLVVAIPNQPSG